MTPLAKVMERGIFKVPARRKRKPVVNPSDIPTFNYSAHSMTCAGYACAPEGNLHEYLSTH